MPPRPSSFKTPTTPPTAPSQPHYLTSLAMTVPKPTPPTSAPPAPPFTKSSSIRSSSSSLYPGTFRHNHRFHDPCQNTHLYLALDLQTSKLRLIQSRLWLAGLSRPSRPLHRQILMRRAICLTERPDEHLVWHENYIFVKPLPEYLLDYGFWEQNLCADTGEGGLFESACGLLLSYVWLVEGKSDFRIAKETGIMPANVEWEAWTGLVRDFLSRVDTTTLKNVDRRYHYGELRLSRLNTLYRFSPATFSLHNLVYGFMSSSTWYTAFFERNFGWILAVFIYITVVLSAMQVGLATERLQTSTQFQDFSYGIALTSIAVVIAAVVLVLWVWFGLFCFHLLSTIQYTKKARLERQQKVE